MFVGRLVRRKQLAGMTSEESMWLEVLFWMFPVCFFLSSVRVWKSFCRCKASCRQKIPFQCVDPALWFRVRMTSQQQIFSHADFSSLISPVPATGHHRTGAAALVWSDLQLLVLAGQSEALQPCGHLPSCFAKPLQPPAASARAKKQGILDMFHLLSVDMVFYSIIYHIFIDGTHIWNEPHLNGVNGTWGVRLSWGTAQVLPLTPQLLQEEGASIRVVMVLLPEGKYPFCLHLLSLQLLHRILPPVAQTPFLLIYTQADSLCSNTISEVITPLDILIMNEKVKLDVRTVSGFSPFTFLVHLIMQKLSCFTMDNSLKSLIRCVHGSPKFFRFAALVLQGLYVKECLISCSHLRQIKCDWFLTNV